MSLIMGTTHFLPFFINQTDLLAGTAFEIVAPVDGFITEITGIVQTAVGTGGAVTVKIGTTDVAGLSLTVADAATKGTVVSDTPSAGPASGRAVSKGDRIQIVPAAEFATSGALNGHLSINTAK